MTHVVMAIDEDRGQAHDAIERRAQLVRHRQRHLAAQFIELLLRLALDLGNFFQARIDRGEQFRRGKRLGEVIVRAHLHAAPHVRPLDGAGQEHERNGGRALVFPELRQRAEAIELGHVHVANDQVRQVFAGQRDAVLTVLGEDSFKSEHVQRLLDDHADLGSVVYDENFLHRARATLSIGQR
jgi:hypothetical protein